MHITLSVFFNGTSHHLIPNDTLTPLALILSHQVKQTESQHIQTFDGIGITHGLSGTLFGTGMDEHCEQVIQKIKDLLKKGHTVTLNAYGHSRGAISALMLAKQLSHMDQNTLTINLALHDPVPGNYITTGLIDPFQISLTQKTMDLQACKPLKKVLALYPHEPLATIECHAPLFPQYPKTTTVRTEIVPGCHSSAQWQHLSNQSLYFESPASFISFYQMRRFLKECGTQFHHMPPVRYKGYPQNNNYTYRDLLCIAYDLENQSFVGDSTRLAHSATGQYIQTKKSAQFFNLHHQKLQRVQSDPNQVRVTLEEKGRWLHPTVNQVIKGLILSLGFTGLLFFAGIDLIPSLIIGIALVALCYSPVGQWGVNRFFYPQFRMRNRDENTNGEAQKLELNPI